MQGLFKFLKNDKFWSGNLWLIVKRHSMSKNILKSCTDGAESSFQIHLRRRNLLKAKNFIFLYLTHHEMWWIKYKNMKCFPTWSSNLTPGTKSSHSWNISRSIKYPWIEILGIYSWIMHSADLPCCLRQCAAPTPMKSNVCQVSDIKWGSLLPH